ncbi:glycosyl transferase, family 4 [Candidatus Endolissoclinum faulkneri L5]|uniref:Glycosyl transferase, family 4 n=1 Tax=Candidatus Endolissoclinum faulkneri L5 TaxID=1401328 RepID=V9TUP5_9PROT|nr:glycosyltransferase family 4 protein [Candidatus Endolissoclinum faulkneri]AHC73872.1 glycosyl transferase, family 4 [Candidatus Endolissoclinum faulkneri L5]
MHIILIFTVFAALLSFFATQVLLNILRHSAFLDYPNNRSSHAIPTPRGGGIAVIATITVTAISWEICFGKTNGNLSIMLCTTIALSVISFINDLSNLTASLRLIAHGIAVMVGLWSLGGRGAFGAYLPQIADLTLSAIAWIWFINLYNFMDGIDGIVAGETAFLGFGIESLAYLGLAPTSLVSLSVAIFGTSLGFLMWNWHQAKIFLGDSGSIPLGFMIGYLLIATAKLGGPALVASLILPLVFVVDSSLTLLRRVIQGNKMTAAHREHAYQLATQAGWSHDSVCLIVLATNCILMVLSWGVLLINPLFSLFLGMIVALGCFFFLLKIGTRAQRTA